MGKYARKRAAAGNRKRKPLRPGRKKQKKGAKKNAQRAPKLWRRRCLLREKNLDEKRELYIERLVILHEELRTNNYYWSLVRLVKDLHFDVEPLDPSDFPVHQVQHVQRGGLDLRCPPEILRRSAPLVMVGQCLCGLPREVCHRHRDGHHGEMWPIRQKIRADQEVSLSEATNEGLERQEPEESLPLKKVNWPYEECFQLRNWLQIVKSKQWNRYEFQEPFKNLLLPALTKAISPRLGMVEDAAMLEEFLSKRFDAVFSKDQRKKLLPRIIWALCWDFREDFREMQRQRQMDTRRQEHLDAIMAFCQKAGGYLTSRDVRRIIPKRGTPEAGKKRSQAWLAAGVYELGEFIQDRFKAVLPPKYLVRMDHIAHRRQLKDRKRAPKEIEVNGEMMPWNRFEVQQGNEDTKGNGEEEETTNLSKAKENKGTAAGRQATKRKTHENEEEEDSKQDVKKIKVKAKEEEVGHGEEETAWKQVQKAKGNRKAQGKSESRLQALQALQALQGSGREDESSKKDGKEFRGKGNGEEEDQKEPVEKAEDAKDKQARAEKAATKEAKEAAKQEAEAKKDAERIEKDFARAKERSAKQIAKAKAKNGDDVKVEPNPAVLQFLAAMKVPEPTGGAEKMKWMLDQLNAFPHNVQLRCRCVYHLLDGWKGTRDSGESDSRTKFAQMINDTVDTLYTSPCGDEMDMKGLVGGQLHLLSLLIPRRVESKRHDGEETFEVLKRLDEPATPLSLEMELKSLADLTRNYPHDLLLWQLMGAALTDERCSSKLVFDVFIPRFRDWGRTFFRLKDSISPRFSGLPVEVFAIWVLIMSYLLAEKVPELLKVIEARPEGQEDEAMHYGATLVKWPGNLKQELKERLPLHGAPLQPMTSMLLGGHLPSSYTACVGPEAAPRPVRPWRPPQLEQVEEDANYWDYVPKQKAQPPDEVIDLPAAGDSTSEEENPRNTPRHTRRGRPRLYRQGARPKDYVQDSNGKWSGPPSQKVKKRKEDPFVSESLFPKIDHEFLAMSSHQQHELLCFGEAARKVMARQDDGDQSPVYSPSDASEHSGAD